MPQNKGTKTLSELTSTFCDAHKKPNFFTDYVSILKLGKLHCVFSTAKQKGTSGLSLMNILISLPFMDKENVHDFMNSSWQPCTNYGKDAYYRLKSNCKINWRNFLFSTVKQAVPTLDGCGPSTGIKAFIFDDTTIKKTGHKIEGMSKVWNHVMNRSVLGYQLLVMGYYDGTMFVPIDFSFHREKGKNKKTPYGLKPRHYKRQHKKKRPKESPGFKRRKELNISKIAMSVSMLKSAVKKGIAPGYLLTDSWFTCWEMVKAAMDNNLKYIGMFCKVKTKFMYRNKAMTYKEIRKLNRKNIKRNKRFNLYYIRAVVSWNGEPVALCFTRKGKRGNWKTLLNTELSPSFDKTVEVYQIRWSIEVFFKESKQLLGLGKSQSTDCRCHNCYGSAYIPIDKKPNGKL